MNLEALSLNLDTLLEYMTKARYSRSYTKVVKDEAEWILSHEFRNKWSSYLHVYQQHVSNGETESTLCNRRRIISILANFEEKGLFPHGGNTSSLFPHGAYWKLNYEFKELVDHLAKVEAKRGLKDSSIHGMLCSTSCFLLAMQKRGCDTIDAVQEEDVLSYFVNDMNGDIKILHGRGVMKDIRTMLKDGIDWRNGVCNKLLLFLPEMKGVTKNVQYLTKGEISKIKATLDAGILNKRNTAIGWLLLATGMRACDIAGLKLSNLNWKMDILSLVQQKTGVLLELPLTSVVGNHIYDYYINERPKVNSEFVFLREAVPYQGMTSGNINNIVNKLFDKAKIRLNPGDRRGSHLFRYNRATELLERGISQPIISAALGHESPSSLDPYIQIDLLHLKKYALDVSMFPVRQEVLCCEN